MIISVKFRGTEKIYCFNSDLNLMRGAVYDIEADGYTRYNNPVCIVDITHGSRRGLRTITDAKLIRAPRVPKKYKKIFVNYEKETVVVLWNDNTRTVMKPQDGEEFDVEKGIALCFMKKAYGNRGCFNNAFRDIIVSE